MSVIDRALREAQRQKSELDAQTGRHSAPVLVRLRAQPRRRMDQRAVLIAAGAVTALVAAVIWFRSVGDEPLPDVPPVTSTILTEALASEAPRDSGAVGSAATQSSRVGAATTGRDVAPEQRPVASATHVPSTSAEGTDASTPVEEPSRIVATRGSAESRVLQAGTIRIAVEQPRNANAAQLFAEAISAHRAQDLERAKALYEQVIAIDSEDGDALNNLGVILSAEGQHDRALALLRRATAVAPRNAGAWNNIGALLREQGKAEEAIAAFRTALAMDPRHQGARVGLAQQYLAGNQLPQARELLEDVLRTNPSLPEAHYTLGQVRELLGDHAGAVAAYGAFIRFAPARLATHVELVRRRMDALSAAR